MMFNTYFSGRPLLAKGSLFNVALSDRSDGKTFDCKFRMLEDYEKSGDITIYIRRYDSEITPKMYNTFFNEVIEKPVGERFSKWLFKYSKDGALVSTDGGDTYNQICYFVPLTMAGKLKSQFDISKIKMLDFDEYCPLNGQYLKDETTLLLELWKSVDRDRDTTQLLICGNKITPFMPILDYFNISTGLDKNKIKLYCNGELALQIYSNKEHRDKRAKSKFRSLIANTPYEEYDSGGVLNVPYIPLTALNDAFYFMAFRSYLGEGTIWSNGTRLIVSSKKRQDGELLVDKPYPDKREQFNIQYPRVNRIFKQAYKTNNLFFTDETAHHIFAPIMSKCY